jgi:lipoyl(octanoyl) transferase
VTNLDVREGAPPAADGDTRTLVFVHVGFGTAAVPYEAAWDLQRRTQERRINDEIGDSVLLLEHLPVYTAGKRTAALDRPLGDPGAPVIDVDRGGKITWHGPGQLTGYPIVKLPDPKGGVAFVRVLERMMMAVCAEFGLETKFIEDRSGLWVPGSPDRKLGSIGLRVRRGVTMHGFQINCDCELSWFDKINPCGFTDTGSTSLSRELGRPVSVAELTPLVERHLTAALGATEPLHRTTAQLEA